MAILAVVVLLVLRQNVRRARAYKAYSASARCRLYPYMNFCIMAQRLEMAVTDGSSFHGFKKAGAWRGKLKLYSEAAHKLVFHNLQAYFTHKAYIYFIKFPSVLNRERRLFIRKLKELFINRIA